MIAGHSGGSRYILSWHDKRPYLWAMDDGLCGLPVDRVAAISAWLMTPLCRCSTCGLPVFPTDPRAAASNAGGDERVALVHLACQASGPVVRVHPPSGRLRNARSCG